MSKKNFTATGIETMVEEAINECNERGVSVESVEPYEDYFTVKLNNDVNLSTLNAIARKVGSKYMSVGSENDMLALFFKPGESEDSDFDDDDADDYQELHEEEDTPSIPDNMRHTDRFPDAEDVVIPGTEQRVSNTEQCEQIGRWMQETGHYPIVFIRLEDGVHVEVSELFDRKVKAVISEGRAVGGDGRKYSFENRPGDVNLWPIGGDICVRAICDETGRSDMYGLSFFV